eukprot:scaffold27129_cov102-Skeletonema_marinoi.AAC.1
MSRAGALAGPWEWLLTRKKLSSTGTFVTTTTNVPNSNSRKHAMMLTDRHHDVDLVQFRQ